ncbi:major facilitator superfamily domain-containing protein [Mycena albidolilacea]|uniref:Major facilitator superfamily domain-containing protein n=1 Tax=Mycena albidolilacea TaxID=1033008 RepID=A0AAD7AH63_9AGAR|nr:major facilitator superfamily domain-containing protein [Mycena albidolilacea]
MASQLARSDSVTTGTSYEIDINEKSAAKPPAQALPAITEGEEDDNVGYNVYKQGLAEHELTPEENRTIRWRIDLIVLPMFLITQTLQFLDKTALNYANLFGFQTALKLKGNQFNWLSGMVYFGYAFSQYPIQILIGKFPAQKVLAVTIFMWGLCVLTMSQCTNFKTAMINRFILGMFEASVSPGLTLMTGWWYTRHEIPLRQFIWYSALGWGGVIGSYISTGISSISPTAPGPEKWQYIFYILGAVTMAWAFVIFFFLPDSPASARWLTPQQRIQAVQRVAANQTGIKNKKFKREQVIVAIKDIKIWILFSSVFAAAIPNGVVSNFSSVIIKDMGFSTTKTTVLKSVGDITQIVALVVGGIITLNFKNTRLIASMCANIICVVAAACMAYLPRHLVWQRLVSFWLVNCQSVGFAVSLVMVSSNMGGYTHRTIASAVIFTAYCFGNVAGPFVKQSQAPFYQDATAGLLAGYSIKLVCQIVLFFYMYITNKRRDAKYGEPDVTASKEAGMQDKTEYENKNFRYVL